MALSDLIRQAIERLAGEGARTNPALRSKAAEIQDESWIGIAWQTSLA